ncbi:sugar ABC transporter substrate-binding protein [Nocardiopsis trehalosi]|jgi:arabinogalactan oligomer/maltooligosaccharide transport system substrate-binding protein|uniref:sugar ABC transporter substrate-binding protein n=1 Tax=Nocardiopsis trehalosi TaxID=109329 RepID=UPI00082FB1BA|nr:maltose ABC transporter substrate-binding protein [Nocardiopsis trehalosi]
MRIRSAGVLAGTAALTLAATACGGGGGAAEEESAGALVIWTDTERGEVLGPFAEEFGESNGIEVDIQTVAVDQLQSDFLTAHEGGSGPDILVGAHDWIGNLVQNNAIDPVELPQETADGFTPTSLEAATYEGRLYGVPYAQENLVLLRNTELAPDAPATVEELVETGAALVDSGDADEILGLQVSQTGDPYHLQPFFTSGGGYLFGTDDEGGYDPADLGIDSPESIAAFERIAELGEEGEGALKRSIDADNVKALFEDGRTPFFVTGPWNIAGAQEAGIDYDISPVPGFEGAEEPRPFVGVQAFFVASGGQNKVLAEEFVTNYVADPELAVALYEADPRPPALTAALEQVGADDPDVAKIIEAGENGQPMPAIPEMAAVFDPFGKAQAAIISGADPEETLRSAAENIRNEIG